MLHLNIKPQNQLLVLLIFILGGTWGIVISWRFKGLFDFFIDGTIILVITVLLGNLTHLVLSKMGFRLFDKNRQLEEQLLDAEIDPKVLEPSEDEKEKQPWCTALSGLAYWCLAQ